MGAPGLLGSSEPRPGQEGAALASWAQASASSPLATLRARLSCFLHSPDLWVLFYLFFFWGGVFKIQWLIDFHQMILSVTKKVEISQLNGLP